MLLDDYINIQNRQYVLMGDEPAPVVAKAKNGEVLTDTELVVIDAFLLSKYLQFESYEWISRDGVYSLDEDLVVTELRREWDFPYARQWWIRERELLWMWEGQRLSKILDRLYGLDDH